MTFTFRASRNSTSPNVSVFLRVSLILFLVDWTELSIVKTEYSRKMGWLVDNKLERIGTEEGGFELSSGSVQQFAWMDERKSVNIRVSKQNLKRRPSELQWSAKSCFVMSSRGFSKSLEVNASEWTSGRTSNPSCVLVLPICQIPYVSVFPIGHIPCAFLFPIGHIPCAFLFPIVHIPCAFLFPIDHIPFVPIFPIGHIVFISVFPIGHIPCALLFPIDHIPSVLIFPIGHILFISAFPIGHIHCALLFPIDHIPSVLMFPIGHILFISVFPIGHIPCALLFPIDHIPFVLMFPIGHIPFNPSHPRPHYFSVDHILLTLKMKTSSYSETSLSVYNTAQCQKPRILPQERSLLQKRENLYRLNVLEYVQRQYFCNWVKGNIS